jgi:hypothetical protein
MSELKTTANDQSMVGFGNYHYQYASGREGDWFLVEFSPCNQNLTLYNKKALKKISIKVPSPFLERGLGIIINDPYSL